MKILAAYPYYPDSRTRVRSFETLKLLAALGDVTAVFPATDGEIFAEDVLGMSAQVIAVPDSSTGRLLRVLRAAVSQKTITYAFYCNAAEEFAKRNTVPFDLVFVERLPITPAVKRLGKAVIYDAVDSFEVQTKLLARAAGGLKRFGYIYDSTRINREQVGICNNADGVLCTTSLEEKRLTEAGVTSEIQPYLHTSQVTRLSPQSKVDNKVRPRAVFHGRGSYAANQAAGQQIRNNIAPAASGTDFIIFGSDWQEAESANLRILGFQKDLAMLWAADFAIFPLDVAVGVQNKVVEALAAGLPCIVTPVVAEGLPTAIREGLKSQIHIIKLRDFPAFIKNHAHSFHRDEASSVAFASIYTNLIAKERSAVIDFIEGTLSKKRR